LEFRGYTGLDFKQEFLGKTSFQKIWGGRFNVIFETGQVDHLKEGLISFPLNFWGKFWDGPKRRF